MHNFMTRLGEAIKNQRQAQGLTQRDLADASGLHQTHISKIEKGKAGNLGCLGLLAIADALGTRGHFFYALAETDVFDDDHEL